MGPQNMSSCESFLLMMHEIPGCKLIGEKSYGSSGNPKPVELENGVTVLLPSWKDTLPDGTLLEGKGIEPDITVPADADMLMKRDPVLNAALQLLRASGTTRPN
jgi:C-terminal processing protease CtpA/Prc